MMARAIAILYSPRKMAGGGMVGHTEDRHGPVWVVVSNESNDT